ncbi:cytochrome P450 [Rhodococcus wratislaviensis]|nr:cytochrome P450 [Rhodococcus wratislaviensis]
MAPLETLSTMLLGMQPPKHTQVRSLLSKAFVPRTMASLETPIRELVTDLIDKVIDRGECDLVNDIAVPLPLVVIAKLIGFPEDSTERFHDWSLRFVAIQDSEARGGGAEETVKALEEISAYANEVAELRRRDPRDDLLSILANAEIDGVRMDEFEIAGMVVQLIGAGNETSRNTLSLGIMGMLENRDQWDRLTADRGLVGVAVEEMLRWVSPVYYMRRTATVDTELEGKTIRTGDKVVQWLVAANYDPELNDNPEVLDITRPRVRHYAFGAGGPKFCLGSALARLELRVALDELARRLPDLEICGPSHRMQSNFLNSLLSLPVRF